MKTRLVLLLSALSILVFSMSLQAQDTGSMTGSVTDSTGAAVTNAQVVVSSAERGINRTTSSNASGEWVVPGLTPGSYDLAITAPGFKKYQAKGVVLRVAQKARVDVALQVGAASTEVTVEGTAVAQVETQSSEMAGTVTGKEISQLQLNGRVFTQLVTLTPGVSNQTGSSEGQYGITANTNYSVNGGRLEYNNWELDGGDNMDNGSNATLNVTPSIDAIAEVRVLTSNYGAQYGRNASGTVETETKSGTSSFHGDAYEFLRNDAFNAAPHFQPSVPSYKKNDWDIPSAVRFTFRVSTIQARARPSFFGRRNGVAIGCRARPLISRCLRKPRSEAISAIFAPPPIHPSSAMIRQPHPLISRTVRELRLVVQGHSVQSRRTAS